MRENKSS